MEEIQNKTSFTLLDIIQIFLAKKKAIFTVTFLICVISIILYFFVFDLVYFSNALIKSSARSSGLFGGIESGLPDLGGLDDLGLGVGKSAKELATYEQILKSRRCIEPLVDKFGLMDKGEFKFKEDAINAFEKGQLVVEQDKLSSMLNVGVYDKNPARAREMVEFLLAQLDKINIEVSIQNATNNREFIEKRYFQSKEDVAKAEDSLKSFQLIYGIAPDLQIKASAQSVYTLEAELKAEEVKLDVIKTVLSSEQPEVKIQETKVNSLKNKIESIRTSTDINDILSLGNSPQVAMSFLRLQRDVEIQNKIMVFLLPLYEQAKIEEKKETPTIIVLDKPYIAERKSKPKRLTMVVAFTFLGFIFANVFFLVKDRYKYFKAEITRNKKA